MAVMEGVRVVEDERRETGDGDSGDRWWREGGFALFAVVAWTELRLFVRDLLRGGEG
jgi:hypothetical protein